MCFLFSHLLGLVPQVQHFSAIYFHKGGFLPVICELLSIIYATHVRQNCASRQSRMIIRSLIPFPCETCANLSRAELQASVALDLKIVKSSTFLSSPARYFGPNRDVFIFLFWSFKP